MKNDQTDFLHIGEQKGYIELLNEATTIHYIAPDKKRKFTDPEEQVRARFYVELIEYFQYAQNLIDLEVTVPRRTPSDLADIVVFSDDDKKSPFIVVECKKDEISEAEFEQAVEQAFGNCNSLGGYYTVVVAGSTRRSFDVKNHKPGERTENIIADPPIGYGKVQEWRYLKGIPRSEPSVIERGDLIRVLEKCHNTLWQGGRLTPTDAFDELAKILFIKIRDEKKARRDGDPYDFQIKTRENAESVANRINRLYREAKAQDPEVFTEDIEIDESRLFSVVNHLQGISLNQTDLDVKGVAFVSNDALVNFDTLYDQHKGFEKERFDVILTNPPFGAVIKQSELPYLENYELGRGNASQKTEILFLERCFDFLKWETGKLAIILPDGILTNPSLQYVRDYIERHFQILAVVSLPQIAFSHYGAGVKTSILFLRKFSEQEYDHYQAAINQITDRNQAIYTPKITALEDERKSLIAKGSPAQVDVTETYRQQFISILDSIDAL